MRAARVAVLLLSMAAVAAGETFDLRGFVTGRGEYTSGLPSWMRGGLGRFDTGGSAPEQGEGSAVGDLQLGVDWQPVSHLLVHAHGLSRAEPSANHGRRAGIVSAYVEADFDRGRNDFSLRAGQFFLGTSRENTADLWSSPYTITYSALNSWIANEVRPVGVNAEWRLLTSNAVITTAVTGFKNNDTMGALLAWRGWTIGNRLSVYNEVLPLPPLESLDTTFRGQRRDGTVPFESDLDGRIGYAARIRYAIPERFNIQFTRVDNRGDRLLHRGEYAWATDFNHIGAELHVHDTTALAEWMSGRTTMGPALIGVDANFYAAYGLVSQHTGRNRFSGRLELFETSDNRPVLNDRYDEHGRAWTLSWLYDVRAHWRAGVEFTQVTGTHAEAVEADMPPRFDGRSYIVEVRYSIK
jgi:hypothetical protein